MLPPCHVYDLASIADCHPLPLGAAPDDREAERVDARSGRERHALQLELDPATRTCREVACVDGEAVRDVGQRVGDGGQASALFQAQRGPGVTALTEGGSGGAERAGDDHQVAWYCAGA